MEQKLREIRSLVKELKTKHNLKEHEIISHIIKEDVEIPLSIFGNKELSSLETIVKYMKEELNIRTSEIAKMLHRSDKTIWATYNKAKTKMKDKLIAKEGIVIPVYIFRARLLSILESLVEFLKENHKMRYCEIAVALNRDDRTIWTTHRRAIKKRKI